MTVVVITERFKFGSSKHSLLGFKTIFNITVTESFTVIKKCYIFPGNNSKLMHSLKTSLNHKSMKAN